LGGNAMTSSNPKLVNTAPRSMIGGLTSVRDS
jgi:hypothetical protein